MFNKTKEELPLYYFEEISRIPRDSGNEMAISNYIKAWAENLGLETIQEPCYNLIIKKPASAGYEEKDPVVLQAHMDMVCEKNADSSHDFTKDPVILSRDGDWLVSATGTTLGADNGIGVAYCMALLEDDSICHPAIEVLLTVAEESTFEGAESADWSNLKGRRLINLDHSVENQILCSSCGGIGAELHCQTVAEDLEEQDSVFLLSVSGLAGGHSGEDIHRGYGSAIQMLMRLLRVAEKDAGAKLIFAEGGTSRLAISREAKAMIAAKADLEELGQILAATIAGLHMEYATTAPELKIEICVAEKEAQAKAFSEASFRKLLMLMNLLPDGIQTMNGAFSGTVESSINLGILRANTESISITAEIRGGFEGSILDIRQKVSDAAEMFDCDLDFFVSYAPWAYRAESSLRKTAARVYQEMFGEEIEAIAVHAGIECGCFLENVPNLDAIAIGPNCLYFHSPLERMSITSAKKVWKWLITLIGEV